MNTELDENVISMFIGDVLGYIKQAEQLLAKHEISRAQNLINLADEKMTIVELWNNNDPLADGAYKEYMINTFGEEWDVDFEKQARDDFLACETAGLRQQYK